MSKLYNHENIFNAKTRDYSYYPLILWKEKEGKEKNINELCEMIINEVCWRDRQMLPKNSYYDFYNLMITKNKFISKNDKDTIETCIHNMKRRKYLACKYYRLWLIRTIQKFYKCVNEKDLMLDTFNNEQKCIYITENLYVFKYKYDEMKKIIISSIISSSYQTPYIKQIKNVYTHNKLSKIQLYNVYVQMKSFRKNMHWLIEEYCRHDFEPTIMLKKHYNYLKEFAIKEDIMTLNDNDFREEAKSLLELYVKHKMLSYFQNSMEIKIDHIGIEKLRQYLTIPIIRHTEKVNIENNFDSFFNEENRGFPIAMTAQIQKNVFHFIEIFPDIVKIKEVAPTNRYRLRNHSRNNNNYVYMHQTHQTQIYNQTFPYTLSYVINDTQNLHIN
tara:strand:+ start:1348 stop:2508 length:1161 start_codon:yes stop_codon:yes gene_type:complete